MLDRFQAVTIDFHNTLMRCDEWFRLEVFDLVPAFLNWMEAQEQIGFRPDLHEQGRQRYRELRREVIASGIELDAAECIHRTMDHLSIAVSDSEIDQGLDAIMRPQISDAAPMEGAVALVKALQGRGMPMAVVSSAVYHPYLVWTLETYGMLDAFEQIISSASCGLYKSTPDIYQLAAQTLDAPPSACLHIGDSWRYDVDSAAVAGFSTALVGNGHQREAGNEKPTFKANTLDQLHASLFGITEMAT